MISQQRIQRSKEQYRRLRDKRGIVANIVDKKKPNNGRVLEPFKVTEIFKKTHNAIDKALTTAVRGFRKSPNKKKA